MNEILKHGDNNISFGKFALHALEPALIGARQIETRTTIRHDPYGSISYEYESSL